MSAAAGMMKIKVKRWKIKRNDTCWGGHTAVTATESIENVLGVHGGSSKSVWNNTVAQKRKKEASRQFCAHCEMVLVDLHRWSLALPYFTC